MNLTSATIHGNAHLTEEQVQEIRRLYAEGTKQNDLVARFGVSQPTISKAVHGKAYTRVPRGEAIRYCIDCHVPLSSSGKRCERCLEAWESIRYQHWAEERGIRKRPAEKSRYGIRYEQADKGYVVIDRKTGKRHGVFTLNRARYLATKWNRHEQHESEAAS